jgi:hypothetical protein
VVGDARRGRWKRGGSAEAQMGRRGWGPWGRLPLQRLPGCAHPSASLSPWRPRAPPPAVPPRHATISHSVERACAEAEAAARADAAGKKGRKARRPAPLKDLPPAVELHMLNPQQVGGPEGRGCVGRGAEGRRALCGCAWGVEGATL